jgi:hypothetical protein
LEINIGVGYLATLVLAHVGLRADRRDAAAP